ncbi:hypothetical protein ACFVYA_40840 [Amycolatopsis sp. NPDC058278]|uniref:hypothetical protein n=1 Tax=Amycolatopsis sp. NPDC058278 TaxID=3346417 RepID=UPI0036D77753
MDALPVVHGAVVDGQDLAGQPVGAGQARHLAGDHVQQVRPVPRAAPDVVLDAGEEPSVGAAHRVGAQVDGQALDRSVQPHQHTGAG